MYSIVIRSRAEIQSSYFNLAILTAVIDVKRNKAYMDSKAGEKKKRQRSPSVFKSITRERQCKNYANAVYK